MACSLDLCDAEPAPEVRLYHVTQLAARTAVIRWPNGRQRGDAQPRCSIRQREYALIFAEPHGFVLEQERHDRNIRTTGDFECSSTKTMQPACG
jgi:hypothetical protein